MSLLHNHNYRLLWFGQLMTQAASRIYLVVLSWYFVSTLNNPKGLVLLMIFSALPPLLLSVSAGALADRFNKKALLIGCDLFSGLVTLGLAFALSRSAPSSVIYACGIALSAATVFFNPALRSLVPGIAGKEHIQQAMAGISGIGYLAQFIGAALGGLLMAHSGAVAAILVNAVAFFVSAACGLFLRDLPPVAPRHGSFIESMREGIVYARSQTVLFRLLLIFSISNIFLVPLNVLLPVLVKDELHLGAKIYGIANSCIPVGSLVAAVLLASRAKGAGAGKTIRRIQLCMGATVFALLGVAVSPDAGMLFASLCAYGFILNSLNIGALSLFAGEVSPEYQGRFFSLVDAMAMGSYPIGYLLGGVAMGHFQSSSVLAGMATSIGLLAILCFFVIQVPKTREAAPLTES